MQNWLRERGERVPDPTAHEAMHTSHKMAGMATPEQMAELAAAESIGVRSAIPQADDPPPRGRGEDGRGAARTAGLGLRSDPVRVHE